MFCPAEHARWTGRPKVESSRQKASGERDPDFGGTQSDQAVPHPQVDKGRPKVPGKVRVQFCHFCFAAPSIQNTWRKILLPPRRAAKVRADARPPAACTPARVVRGRLPTWGAGRARWQPGAPKQVFPFSAMYFCMEGAQKWQN